MPHFDHKMISTTCFNNSLYFCQKSSLLWKWNSKVRNFCKQNLSLFYSHCLHPEIQNFSEEDRHVCLHNFTTRAFFDPVKITVLTLQVPSTWNPIREYDHRQILLSKGRRLDDAIYPFITSRCTKPLWLFDSHITDPDRFTSAWSCLNFVYENDPARCHVNNGMTVST